MSDPLRKLRKLQDLRAAYMEAWMRLPHGSRKGREAAALEAAVSLAITVLTGHHEQIPRAIARLRKVLHRLGA